ncbi:hypothetical protein [Amycolatopsis sp. NPDC059657]
MTPARAIAAYLAAALGRRGFALNEQGHLRCAPLSAMTEAMRQADTEQLL